MASRWREYVRGGRRRIETTIAVLDKLSRKRALTMAESLQLEHAIKAQGCPSRTWLRWDADEVEKARKLRAKGLSCGQIALSLHRTPDAIAAQLRALRLREEGR